MTTSPASRRRSSGSFEQLDQFGRERWAPTWFGASASSTSALRGQAELLTIEVQRQRLLLYLHLEPKRLCSPGTRAGCET